MNTTCQLRGQAWRRMFQTRTCPPLGVLQQGGPFVERHLASCTACRITLENIDAFARAGAFLAKIPPQPRQATRPAPGDIRRVRPGGAPADWFDAEGRYRNPPLVLVLTAPDGQGFVRVAQIFDEPALCDQGDVPLENGEYGFAEAWNVYGLPEQGLAPTAYRKADAECAARVLEASRQDFPALDTASALYQFRLCEVETGSFFSLALNAEALAVLEAAEAAGEVHMEAPRQRTSPLAGLIERFRKAAQNWLGDGWSSLAEPLPLAAASEQTVEDGHADDVIRIPCLAAFEGDGAPKTIPAEVHVDLTDDGFFCTAYCRIPGGHPHAEAATVCGGVAPSGGAVHAKVMEDGLVRIRAEFMGKDLRPQDLRLALLLCQDREGDGA